jgi:LCP family protein required for cell wall assembly
MNRSFRLRRFLQALGILLLALSLTALSSLYYVAHLWSGRRHVAPMVETRELVQAAFRPEQLFPGRNRLNILCLGLDRDWTDQNLPYSTQSRTDTMMVASLDLLSQRVTTLSIPRDMRVEIPRHGFRKINAAYPCGGVALTRATVDQFLGVGTDYYVLVKLGAVQRFIDAIGGVTLAVEKEMHYDDNWGHLHVHLKRGVQHLNGEQVEEYLRFRHDAESDFGRMRRQQQAMRAILARLQSPSVAMRVPQLIGAFSRSIETNLSREQILGLASLFHQVRPETVVGDALPGRERVQNGIDYLEPIEGRQRILVDWLLKGESTAANRLTTVRVVNGCGSRKTVMRVVQQLREQEFATVYAGRAREAVAVTRIEGRGRHAEAGQRVATALQVGGVPPWVAGKGDPVVTVTVGQDQVARAQTSEVLADTGDDQRTDR